MKTKGPTTEPTTTEQPATATKITFTDLDLRDALLSLGADTAPVDLMTAVKAVVNRAGGDGETITTNSAPYKRAGTRLKELAEAQVTLADGGTLYRIARHTKPGGPTSYGVTEIKPKAKPAAAAPRPAAAAAVPPAAPVAEDAADDTAEQPERVTAVAVLQGDELGNVPVEQYALETYPPDALATMGKRAHAVAKREIDDVFAKLTERATDEISALPERIAVEDAVRFAVLFDRREALHSDAGHMERFKLGVVARRVSDASGYGDQSMEQLAEATGVHVNTVRECRRLAERYSDSIEVFARFLNHFRTRSGRAARWYHVQKIIGTFSDVSVLGAEALAELVAGGIERAAERAEQAAGESLDEDTMFSLSQTAEATRVKAIKRLAQHKVAVDSGELAPGVFVPRDEGFMRTVALLPDAIDGESPPEGGWDEVRIANDPHHTGTGGTGIKGSDYTCIPLKRVHHDYLHAHGIASFQKKFGVSIALIMFNTMHLFITGVRADLPAGLNIR